jgi:hypothetical protein
MSILYTINGMLTLRDTIKSLFGMSLDITSQQASSINLTNNISVSIIPQGLNEKIKAALKKITVTQGYY